MMILYPAQGCIIIQVVDLRVTLSEALRQAGDQRGGHCPPAVREAMQVHRHTVWSTENPITLPLRPCQTALSTSQHRVFTH